ncbi:MAG: LamG domain-containing protein [Crocosphaera sp.]
MVQQQQDYALYFGGDGDYIKIEDNEALRLDSYTVEVWVQPDGLQGKGGTGLIGKDGPNYNMWLTNDTAVSHRFKTIGGGTNVGPETLETKDGFISANHWSHIVITNDGTTARTYIDGVLREKTTFQHSLDVSNTALIIGCNPATLNENSLKGHMAEVRLWNTVPSALDIQDNMYHRLTGSETGLVGYWPLNEVEDGYVADKTGNGNKGKVFGATLDAQLPLVVKGENYNETYRESVVRFGDPLNATNKNYLFFQPDRTNILLTNAMTFCLWAKSNTRGLNSY